MKVLLIALLLIASVVNGAYAQNPVVTENQLQGTPASQWDLNGSGSTTLQGFSTDISVNHGSTVYFKIQSGTNNWRIDIYRLGYYQGNGARLVTSIPMTTAKSQPAPVTNPTTGEVDAGNWGVTASWAVPSNAVSGVYIAHLVDQNNASNENHIPFIVRADESNSEILFQTSDTTWQAYNGWGGANLYGGNGPGGDSSPGRAYKVSYNRPIATRDGIGREASWTDFLFGAEYAAIYWLEQNGYDISYIAGVDTARSPSLLTQHKVFTSTGHDEYWDTSARANVEAARRAGVHLIFMSGNEVYWKTRWEPSIDGSASPYRTLVCYKETRHNAPLDPLNKDSTWTWTGTWRDPRLSPPADGGKPENSLTGTIFQVDAYRSDAIQIPYSMSQLRFWRNTPNVSKLTSGNTWSLTQNILGYEWDTAPDNGFAPEGLIKLSSTTLNVNQYLLDYGSHTGNGTATHNLTLYRDPTSGALVFGAGTVFWSWGLSAEHDGPTTPTDPDIQQAMVNLLADMGVQPGALQAGLIAAAKSTDTTPPTSTISTPSTGSSFKEGQPVTISGTASDTGGRVAGVEVSVDGGTTWYKASGTTNWSFTWNATGGPHTIIAIATDDSLNTGTPQAGKNINVVGSSNLFGSTVVPESNTYSDSSVELGIKFSATTSGTVTGIRFWKNLINTGTHVGNLWTSTGTLLASATFVNETASGWQEVLFSQPVQITPSTTYVASYHSNNAYSAGNGYFLTTFTNDPLIAPASAGVYTYGPSSIFPTTSFNGSNYWVDVMFVAATLQSIAVTPANPTLVVGATQQFTATGTYSEGSTKDLTSKVTWTSSATGVATINSSGLATGASAGSTSITATSGSVSGSKALTVTTAALGISTTSLSGGTVDAPYSANLAAIGGTLPYSWSLTAGSLPPGLGLSSSGVISGTPTTAGTYAFTAKVTDPASQTANQAFSLTIAAAPTSIWPSSTVPGVVDSGDASAVELGVKFTSDVAGTATGIRFYKASANTGTHVGNLWSCSNVACSNGTNLATVTFTGESASGWQQMNFSTPVAITPGTAYVVSYHTNAGHYSFNGGYFAATGFDNGPLHALANGVSGGNGVYAYGSSSAFPTNSYNSSNYWVDVLFSPAPAPTLQSIAVAPLNPSIATGATQQFTAIGTYSDGSTQNLTQVTWTSSSTAVATINSSGLASGANVGSTAIKATSGSVSNTTGMSVTAAALSISTSSLPSGTVNTAYSASLTAIGGTLPYTWSFTGTLPPGLTLSSNGIISGISTTTGTYPITAKVTDSTNQTATKALNISVATAAASIWPNSTVPGLVDGGPDSSVELGVKFMADVSGTVTGIRFYKASTNTGTHVGNLWSCDNPTCSTGTNLRSVTFSGESASGWQQMNFSTPVAITANTVYVVSYHTDVGHYSFNGGFFATAGSDNIHLHALANGVAGGNGVYGYGSTSAFPASTYNSANYWVDVAFTTP